MHIYPQAIQGKYRNLRNYGAYSLLLIYFLSSWVRWDRGVGLPNQAILMDLPNRKAYLFFIEIWPEEAYYLTGILILAALGLFFVTSLFGRIWCGYGCPHSVFVDLFLKVELYFQGDRNARIKLDNKKWDKEKIKKKAATFIAWFILSFGFAFGWVCYFYDAPQLLHDFIHMQVTSGALVWLIGLTASTFVFAGYVREKVCTYFCPYGRFQSAMLDNDSNVVTYHGWRGEPRGNVGTVGGDCIDCKKCVLVCPMGIDIRDGLQMQCIGCGLCIDACNSVMEKLKRPLYLIAYDSVNSTKAKMSNLLPKRHIIQIKTTLFAVIFIIVSAFLLYALVNKPTLKFAVLRERGALFTILPDGSYRNNYKLKLENKTSIPKNMELIIKSNSSQVLQFKLASHLEYLTTYDFILPAEDEIELELFVKVDADDAKAINSVNFSINDKSQGKSWNINSFFNTK